MTKQPYYEKKKDIDNAKKWAKRYLETYGYDSKRCKIIHSGRYGIIDMQVITDDSYLKIEHKSRNHIFGKYDTIPMDESKYEFIKKDMKLNPGKKYLYAITFSCGTYAYIDLNLTSYKHTGEFQRKAGNRGDPKVKAVFFDVNTFIKL